MHGISKDTNRKHCVAVGRRSSKYSKEDVSRTEHAGAASATRDFVPERSQLRCVACSPVTSLQDAAEAAISTYAGTSLQPLLTSTGNCNTTRPASHAGMAECNQSRSTQDAASATADSHATTRLMALHVHCVLLRHLWC